MEVRTDHDNQAFFVAVDAHSGCHLLAGLDKAEELIEEVECDIGIFNFVGDGPPTMPGFHVWEGRLVIVTDDEDLDSEFWEWSGDWRPATAADLERFGYPIPAVEDSAP